MDVVICEALPVDEHCVYSKKVDWSCERCPTYDLEDVVLRVAAMSLVKSYTPRCREILKNVELWK